MLLLDYALYAALLWYSSVYNLYNTDVRVNLGKEVFKQSGTGRISNSAFMVQQVIMLLFDHGINTEIFCNIKDAAYIRVNQVL